MSWRGLVLRFFRVPADPAPPPGSTPRTFRAAENYFTLKLIITVLFTILFALIPAGFTVIVWAATREPDTPRPVVIMFQVLAAIAWSVFGLGVMYRWITLRLDFELRWYMISDRAIRIRDGIGTVREKTIAFANIQNVSVIQGPLQRLLGIADVEVKTAGGGAANAGGKGKENPFVEPMHVARFRGVDNADEIRRILGDAVRRQKGAGLGDHDDEPHDDPSALIAAREVLDELRKLRSAGLRT